MLLAGNQGVRAPTDDMARLLVNSLALSHTFMRLIYWSTSVQKMVWGLAATNSFPKQNLSICHLEHGGQSKVNCFLKFKHFQ